MNGCCRSLEEFSFLIDEATSSLDSESEQMIQQDSTTSCAAHDVRHRHRLSTIRRANQILVVESGRIVERGTHEQLLAASGR